MIRLTEYHLSRSFVGGTLQIQGCYGMVWYSFYPFRNADDSRPLFRNYPR